MLPHYLAKVRSSSFGIFGRKCKRKYNMHWFLNTHPILMHLTYLLTWCFNVRFLLLHIFNNFFWKFPLIRTSNFMTMSLMCYFFGTHCIVSCGYDILTCTCDKETCCVAVGQQARVRHMSIQGLVPQTNNYITYDGSLTQPGCQETVTWIIINKPLYISVDNVSSTSTTATYPQPVFLIGRGGVLGSFLVLKLWNSFG